MQPRIKAEDALFGTTFGEQSRVGNGPNHFCLGKGSKQGICPHAELLFRFPRACHRIGKEMRNRTLEALIMVVTGPPKMGHPPYPPGGSRPGPGSPKKGNVSAPDRSTRYSPLELGQTAHLSAHGCRTWTLWPRQCRGRAFIGFGPTNKRGYGGSGIESSYKKIYKKKAGVSYRISCSWFLRMGGFPWHHFPDET